MSTNPVSAYSHYLNFEFLSDSIIIQAVAKIATAFFLVAAVGYAIRSLIGRCSSKETMSSSEGAKAITFARSQLPITAQNSKLPADEEIRLLNELYQKSFKDLESIYRTAVDANGRDVWLAWGVVNAADKCMKIAFAIGALTLYNLGLKQQRALDNPDLHKVLELYKLIRFQKDLGESKGKKTPGERAVNDYNYRFYATTNNQNEWRVLHNQYCRLVRAGGGEDSNLLKAAQEDLENNPLIETPNKI